MDLETSTETLDAERAALADELEDLRIARESLTSSVAELEARSGDLARTLEAREAELAVRRQEVDQLRGTYDGLVQDLQAEVASGRVAIEQLRDGLNVKLSQAILFASGSAQLSTEGQGVIATVAARLVDVPHRVEVQGHTDDRKIRGALAERYPSNWELAGARAASVVRILLAEGLPPQRLRAISFADTQPVESNETADGRAQNRRIEIRLRPVDDAGDEEAE